MTRRRAWVASGAVAAVLVVLLATAAIVAFAVTEQVRGTSMLPTLHDGDRVVVTPGTGGSAHRFDVVVAADPARAGTRIVKRVIAVAGDAVQIRDRTVYVRPGNRGGWERVVEPAAAGRWQLPTPCCTARGTRSARPQAEVVPAGYYFVLGDNRDDSVDSRTFGWLAGHAIDGRLGMRIWPLSGVGGIGDRPRLEPATGLASS